jgi:hypothetical protein
LAEWEALYDLQRTRERDRQLLEKTKAMQIQLAEVTNERDALLTRTSKCDTLMEEMLGLIPVKEKGRMERLIRNAQKMEQDQVSDAMLHARFTDAHPSLTQAELRTCTKIVRGWCGDARSCRSTARVRRCWRWLARARMPRCGAGTR